MKKNSQDSHWNHRIVRAKDEEGTITLSFREVYYNSAGEVCAMTQEPVAPYWSDDIDEFKKIIVGALTKPILDMDKIKYAKFDLEKQVRRVRGRKSRSAKPPKPD